MLGELIYQLSILQAIPWLHRAASGVQTEG